MRFDDLIVTDPGCFGNDPSLVSVVKMNAHDYHFSKYRFHHLKVFRNGNCLNVCSGSFRVACSLPRTPFSCPVLVASGPPDVVCPTTTRWETSRDQLCQQIPPQGFSTAVFLCTPRFGDFEDVAEYRKLMPFPLFFLFCNSYFVWDWHDWQSTLTVGSRWDRCQGYPGILQFCIIYHSSVMRSVPAPDPGLKHLWHHGLVTVISNVNISKFSHFTHTLLQNVLLQIFRHDFSFTGQTLLFKISLFLQVVIWLIPSSQFQMHSWNVSVTLTIFQCQFVPLSDLPPFS